MKTKKTIDKNGTQLDKWIFTFGIGQEHSGYCQPIYANDESIARQLMVDRHGIDWSMQYTEKGWEQFKINNASIWKTIKVMEPIYESQDKKGERS